MNSNDFPILSDPAYRIESELGAGGGGVVYKAWHERLKKYVVLKRIKEDSGLSQEQFRIEVDILKNLKHSHLPQLYDFLTDEGGVYTAMELIPGESFGDLLKKGRKFTQQEVVRWAQQLSSALSYLHKQNPPVLHSDIKPANIMLTPEGDVCLIDFNISLVLDENASMLGLSHGYAAPEQYGVKYGGTASERRSISEETAKHIQSGVQKTSAYSDSSVTVLDGADGFVPGDDGATVIECEASDDGVTVLQSQELLKDDVTVPESQEPPLSGASASKEITAVPAANIQPVPAVSAQVSSTPANQIKYARIDTRTDIYSLGATLYHLLTGERPARATDSIKPLRNFSLPLSEGIIYVIERCMEKDPSKRFQTAQELCNAVENIYAHDSRWVAARAKRISAAIILPVAFAIFAAATLTGFNIMQQEKEERYFSLVYDIQNAAAPDISFEQALEMFWDRIDPYRAMTLRLWNDGDIEACRAFIERNLGNIAKFRQDSNAAAGFGDIYYIYGNCYIYKPGGPDYKTAADCFEIAVQYVTDNPVYFRDYAIALARTGDTAGADKIIERVKQLNIETASLDLLSGEICFSTGDFDNALSYFDNVINTSTDDNLRYRAYHTSDEIYKLLGQPERSIALLSGAMNRIPQNRVSEMTERLADAYIRAGDTENAIKLFDQLSQSGVPQFHIFQSLAVLLQNIKEYERAEEVLERMSDIFHGDYRVPMRRAFLEADKQSTIPNTQRDYSQTKIYYDIAVQMYTDNVRPGVSDTEMQQLEILVDQLRANGWID